MPWLQVNILEGRDEEIVQQLIAGLSETTANLLDVPLESVRVLVNEVPPGRWGVGGIRIDEQRR